MRATYLGGLLVCALLVVGCQTNPTRSDSGSTSRQYSIFYDQGDRLAELIKDGKYHAADAFYASEKPWFDKHAAAQKSELTKLARHLNARAEPALKASVRKVRTLHPSDLTTSDWPNTKARLSDASRVLDKYNKHVVLRDPSYRDPAAKALTQLTHTINATLVAQAPTAFSSYDFVRGPAFFESYPATIQNPTAFLANHFGAVMAKLRDASPQEIDRFRSVYAKWLDKTSTSQGVFDSAGGTLGLYIEQQNDTLVISKLRPGPAESAGLMRGDLLVAVDGKSIHNLADANTVLGRPKRDWTYTFAVRRSGKEKYVTVHAPLDAKRPVAASIGDYRESSEGSPYTRLSNAYVAAALRSTAKRRPASVRAVYQAVDRAKKSGYKPTHVNRPAIGLVLLHPRHNAPHANSDFRVVVTPGGIIPMRKVGLSNALAQGNPLHLDYVLIVSVLDAQADRHIKTRQREQSSYLAGYREEPNPDYEPARLAAYQAQAQLNNINAQVCRGYGCITKAIVVGAASAKYRRAMQTLEETPMTVQRPVFRPYQYVVSALEDRREVKAQYILIDLHRHRMAGGTMTPRRFKTFSLVYNLKNSDKHFKTAIQKYATESVVADFEAKPFNLSAADFINTYVSTPHHSKPVPPTHTLLAQLKRAYSHQAKETPSAESKTDSSAQEALLDHVVVVLNEKGSLGSGFFVTPHLIVTNYHVIQGTMYVGIGMHNGTQTTGKVVRKDIRRDLALIKTQYTGKPAKLCTAPTPVGSTVEAVGHPEGLGFTVTRGVVSAIRGLPSHYDPGGKPVQFIQTDAAINHGNSGGPLYLGSTVVGVNDLILRADHAQGLNFAISCTEVKKFLKGDF